METKIADKGRRGLSIWDVRSAFQWPAQPERTSWVRDERGPRLAVEGRAEDGRRIRAVLYPTSDPGTWELGTAVPMV